MLKTWSLDIVERVIADECFDDFGQVFIGLADVETAGAGTWMPPPFISRKKQSDIDLTRGIEYAVSYIDGN